jgi:hypothetical protein
LITLEGSWSNGDYEDLSYFYRVTEDIFSGQARVNTSGVSDDDDLVAFGGDTPQYSFELPILSFVGGDLLVERSNEVYDVVLPILTLVYGNVKVHTVPTLSCVSAPQLRSAESFIVHTVGLYRKARPSDDVDPSLVDGGIQLDREESYACVITSALTRVETSYKVYEASGIETIDIGRLTWVGDEFLIQDTSVSELDVSRLVSVGLGQTNTTRSSKLEVTLNTNLGALDFFSLVSVGQGLHLSTNLATRVTFPQLRSIGESLHIRLYLSRKLSFPKLTHIGTHLDVHFAIPTYSLDFPKLTHAGAMKFFYDVLAWDSFDMSSLQHAESFAAFLSSFPSLDFPQLDGSLNYFISVENNFATEVSLPKLDYTVAFMIDESFNVTRVHVPQLAEVAFVVIDFAPRLTRLSLPSLTAAVAPEGLVLFDDDDDDDGFADESDIGVVLAFYTAITRVDAPLLEKAHLYFDENPYLTFLAFPQLTIGSFGTDDCHNLTSVNLPVLTFAFELEAYDSISLTSLQVPLLESAYFIHIDNTTLTSLHFPSLTYTRTLFVQDALQATVLIAPVLERAEYEIDVSVTALSKVSLPSLTTVEVLDFYVNSQLADIDLSSLTSAWNVSLNYAPPLTTFSLAQLEVAKNALSIHNNGDLELIVLSALTYVGDFSVTSCPSLTSLDLPALEWVNGYFTVQNTAITLLSIPALRYVLHDFKVHYNGQLLTLDAPVLDEIDGNSIVCQNNDAMGEFGVMSSVYEGLGDTTQCSKATSTSDQTCTALGSCNSE